MFPLIKLQAFFSSDFTCVGGYILLYLLSPTVSVFNLLLVVLKINGFKNTRLPPAKRKQEENVNKTLK